jgi:hypothetical protein
VHDLSGHGAALFAVFAGLAQSEREHSREKSLEGQASARERGRSGGRRKTTHLALPPPQGRCRHSGTTRQTTPDQSTEPLSSHKEIPHRSLHSETITELAPQSLPDFQTTTETPAQRHATPQQKILKRSLDPQASTPLT